MEPTVLDVVLIVGFAARLTRLAVADTIAEWPRILAVRAAGRISDGAVRWTHALLTCPHCIGFWISAAVVASWAAWGHTAGWRLVAAAFTVAYIAGHAVARFDFDAED